VPKINPPNHLNNLDRSNVLVIGLGYVGVPLLEAISGSDKFNLNGYDISENVIFELQNKSGFYKGIDLGKLHGKTINLFSNASDIKNIDIYIICVPTPLLDGGPDLRMLREAGELISGKLKKGDLVILESTSYPGTTEDVLLPILEKSNLKAGTDFSLAFGSERIDPGNKEYGIKNTPKVIGGIDNISTVRVKNFYESFVMKVIEAKGTREAELSKLLENTYRIVNIALINELAMVCHELKIDIWDTIMCASTKPFGFQAFYPGPGVGGHCIPIDPIYLSRYVFENLNKNFELINLSQKINSNMPSYIVYRIKGLLTNMEKKINGSKVLIIGASYKSDISDTRESPIHDIIEEFISEGVEFTIHDSFVKDLKVNGITHDILAEIPTNLDVFDLIVILQHHSDLNMDLLASCKTTIFDTRGKMEFVEKL
jgi:UDP-N-acetyl-D-glucosamine dehydrogenase